MSPVDVYYDINNDEVGHPTLRKQFPCGVLCTKTRSPRILLSLVMLCLSRWDALNNKCLTWQVTV